MKKAMLLFIMFFLTITFVGCNSDTVQDYEANDIEFHMIKYFAPKFKVEISDVYFNFLINEICFDYEIEDYDESYIYYFAYEFSDGRDDLTTYLATEYKSKQEDYCINMIVDDELISVKMSRFKSWSQTHYDVGSYSAGFEYRVTNVSKHKDIEDARVYFGHDYEQWSYRVFQSTLNGYIEDPNHIIDELKFRFYDRENEYKLVYEYVATITDDMIYNDLIKYDYTLNDLAPNGNYLVKLVVSGNDGYTDYKDFFIRRSYDETNNHTYFGMSQSFHGLYAFIFGIEQTSSGLDLDMLVVNDGTYVVGRKAPKLYLNFYRRQYGKDPYLSIPIDAGEYVLSVENSELLSSDWMKIEDKDKTIELNIMWLDRFVED